MAYIQPEDQQMLRELFAKELDGEVTITCFTQRQSVLIVPGLECEYCQATRELLEELVALAPETLHLEVKDFVADEAEAKALGIDRIPAFIVAGKAKGKVRFFGVPAGYEFAGLVQDLIAISTGKTELRPATETALATIPQDLHIQVFVTPT